MASPATTTETKIGTSRIAIVAGLLLLTMPALTAVAEEATPEAWQQTDAFVPGQASGHFGEAVDVQGDTVLVGAPQEGDAGAAYVYERDGGDWIATPLSASLEDDAEAFGVDVALDGSFAVVGDHEERPMSSSGQGGAVYVFQNTGTDWTYLYTITPPSGEEQVGSDFGQSVALDDGTLVVGASNQDTSAGESAGAAFVYTVDATGYTLVDTLTANGAEAGDGFGADVDVDGNTVLVGATGVDAAGETNVGAAYVFDQSGSGFTQVDELVPPDPFPREAAGSSVALDGSTAVVVGDSAYVYEFDGTDWPHSQSLRNEDVNFVEMTAATAAAIDGDRLVVTGTTRPDSQPKAIVFEDVGGEWTETAEVTRDQPRLLDQFGADVALDGDRFAVGAPTYDSSDAGRDGGAAFLFGPCQPSGLAELVDSSLVANAPAETQDTLREANCQVLA